MIAGVAPDPWLCQLKVGENKSKAVQSDMAEEKIATTGGAVVKAFMKRRTPRRVGLEGWLWTIDQYALVEGCIWDRHGERMRS